MQSRWNRRQYWRKTVEKYRAEFFAKTERPHPSPPNVVHLFSSPLVAGGTRYWAFRTAEQRDKFVKLYSNAEVCENPDA